MTIREIPNLHISSGKDLHNATHSLLGFHPSEHLVLVGVNESSIVVTAWIKLADARPVGRAVPHGPAGLRHRRRRGRLHRHQRAH
jgi:hypothetical protein